MIALVMVTAVQNPGLVMALQIVKIRPGAVTSPVMTMMAATVVVVAQLVEVQTVKTVYMTLLLMVVNVVIQPGMNMVLTVLI